METNDVKLSADERKAWERLVELGRKYYLDKKVSAGLAYLANEPGGISGDPREFKNRGRGKRNGERSCIMTEIPERCIRYVLARSGGLTHRKAVEMTGVVWSEISALKSGCEEFRCGWRAMEEASDELIAMMARSTVEEAVTGVEVNQGSLKAAMWGLERLKREKFGDPVRNMASGGSVGALPNGNGGILIQVIGDAAKIAEKRTEGHKAVVYTDV